MPNWNDKCEIWLWEPVPYILERERERERQIESNIGFQEKMSLQTNYETIYVTLYNVYNLINKTIYVCLEIKSRRTLRLDIMGVTKLVTYMSHKQKI